ncbi:MAG: tetratricopeptide repeat protein [Candidatus Thorarchaeota archaeon]
MSYKEPEELIQAEKFIKEGKIEKALQLVNDFGKKKDLTYHERISYYILKSRLATYFFDRNETIEYAKKAYQESKKLENSLLLLDVYIQIANSFSLNLKTNKASEFIKICEDMVEKLPRDLSKKLIKRKAKILWLKGYNCYQNQEFEKAREYAEQSLALHEELDHKSEILLSLFQLNSFSWSLGDLSQALEYTETCKILANNLNLTRHVHQCYMYFGIIYYLKGELDKALIYNEEALTFAEKENDMRLLSYTYNQNGMYYREKGEYNRALENLEKSLALVEKVGSIRDIYAVIDNLFHLALDMNDFEQAQGYLNRMKKIADQEKNQTNMPYTIWYNINRAIYLKNSPQVFNRGKAEQMLKQLIEEGITTYEFLSIAILNLCDLLLFELSTTSELELLDELHRYISQLFETVKKSRSYSLLAETYLLQAKLSLITLDMIKARQFLTKAQEIAEKYGLNRLAIRISNEHDELLKKLDVWENLKESQASLSERMKLARPNKQMERMIQKREIVVPELSDEDPIVLLIITEGGNPLFSESFVEEWTFEDHLFGGFLTAVNSFSGEMFSEGLNRANFGEYTIIINSLHPFLVCYLFKGQSYLAQQRVSKFIDHIRDDTTIWNTFNDYNQSCREVQLKDIPSLEPLIRKIFIDKSIQLEGII